MKTISGSKYYFDKSGAAAKGWITVNKARYYASSGKLRCSAMIKDGKIYCFRKNGALRKGYTKSASKFKALSPSRKKLALSIMDAVVSGQNMIVFSGKMKYRSFVPVYRAVRDTYMPYAKSSAISQWVNE